MYQGSIAARLQYLMCGLATCTAIRMMCDLWSFGRRNGRTVSIILHYNIIIVEIWSSCVLASARTSNKRFKIQRRLAWSLCKDDTQNRREAILFFLPCVCGRICNCWLFFHDEHQVSCVSCFTTIHTCGLKIDFFFENDGEETASRRRMTSGVGGAPPPKPHTCANDRATVFEFWGERSSKAFTQNT